jgi:transposase
LAHRIQGLDQEIAELDEKIKSLLLATAPDLMARFGVGPDTAASLLVAAGDNPERLHFEAAWAHLCGVSPVPADSGKNAGHLRRHPGGDRRQTARCGASPWSASPMIPRPLNTSSGG